MSRNSCLFVLEYGANIGIISKQANRHTKKADFFHTYINICPAFFVPLRPKFEQMVTELLVMWIVGVVAFFVLWAILLKVIKRISEKKAQSKAELEEKPTDLES